VVLAGLRLPFAFLSVGERLRFCPTDCRPTILSELPTSPVPVHRPLTCGFANATVQVAGIRSEWQSFPSEVLNARPTTSAVLAFDPVHYAAAAGAGPWWGSDDSLHRGRTIPCLDCRSPDPDRATYPELCRSDLPDPRWADWHFWPMKGSRAL